ncbi:MAG: adenylate/guanylate cyclase domain-containing protein [Actinobacteria bacterium]|jgi:adenylate cyclase|nr:adenylate/guanylate cyclase domain-containing protein [Actinomycetota bacterium]MDA8185834.1 adenylate/guanylate cyclase domain-containing protein [Actinomycetota bacterium]
MSPENTDSPGGADSRESTTAARQAALERVRAFLADHGATEDEIARAEADEVLDLLVADRMLVPMERRYTRRRLAEMTGMPEELTQRFWRALGFADVPEDELAFTDLDLEAIVTFQAMLHLGVAEVESALQLARVIGSSMSRIADAEVSPAASGLPGLMGSTDSVEEADRFAQVASSSLPAMARLLEFVWRRHVQAATRRAMMLRARGGGPVLAVGFADMVGFTVLSQQLSERDLAAVVSRFEEVAHDQVTSLGGRVVKMIGDEVMFVTESVSSAARIGLGLAEAYADDDLLSDVRVALASGPVLAKDGDCFGPVVNLASRMVGIAHPGSVLVTEEMREELSLVAGEDFLFESQGTRNLKDIGRVQVWSVYRVGSEPASAERKAGRRWERISEILRDLDDLRERGERLLGVGLRAAVAEGARSALSDAGLDPRSHARRSSSPNP